MATAVDTRIPAEGGAAAGGHAPKVGPRRRLFAKYAFALVGLVSLVLLINGSLDIWFSYDEARDAAIRLQREKADAAAQHIEEFIAEIEKQIGWTTATQWASSPIEQRRFDYGRLQRQVPAITELIQLDGQGHEQLKVSRLAMDVVGSGADYSTDPRFTEALAKKVWFGPVYFRKESEPYMTMAVAQSGRNAGVTVAGVNLKLIWDVITAIKIGKSGYAYVVDDKGRLIAHPDISRVLRNTDLSALAQVAAARGTGTATDEPAAIVRNLDGHRVLSASAAIPRLGWLVFVEQPLSEALAPLFTAVLNTGLLLVLGLAVAILAGLLLARRMTGPIRALDAGAARIGAGALDHRIVVRTGDELEELAERFNAMASDLQSSYADLEKKVEDRTAELSEALDQQTATAEVLGVINSSPGDLAPVFEAMLEKALTLCGAAFGVLWTRDGESFRAAVLRRVPAEFAGLLAKGPYRPEPGSGHERLMRGELFVHVEDAASEARIGPVRQALVERGGARSLVAVPLRKDGNVLGVISAYRQEVRPFSDKQIALLQNFAAQAVIAMENARLITETREALEQQTATAEVLQVINSSPGDLAPVFQSIVEKAHTLCGAACGSLQLWDGEKFRGVAMRGFSEAMVEMLRLGYSPSDMPCQRLVEGERVVHCVDLAEIDSPVAREGGVKLGGVRTILYVALRKDDVLLGQIVAARQVVRPFSEKEIALVESFAAQAVIAMENARLITETREALEQQTATAEVLQVINSSPGDLAPVFDAMLEKAVRLCDGAQGTLWMFDGDCQYAAATAGVSAELAGQLRKPRNVLGYQQRLRDGERVFQIADLAATEAYRAGNPLTKLAVEAGSVRTAAFVALVKDTITLGGFTVSRREVRPFTDKQIALLQNFAAQAVIAMENARLITETREALEQQTATAEVLQVINSSPGDLAPVFDALLERAMRLCEAPHGHIWRIEGEHGHAVALRGDPRFVEWLRQLGPGPVVPGSSGDRLRRGEPFVHVLDSTEMPPYRDNAWFRELIDRSHCRTSIDVPLRRDGALLGTINLYRPEVRPFTDKQIALLQNFAAQAVIAMENARLITETREALEQQTATAEVLGVINSSPGDLTPVFDAMLEKALHLCSADYGVLWIRDDDVIRAGAIRGASEEFTDFLLRERVPVDANMMVARAVRERLVIHVADTKESEPYRRGVPLAVFSADRAGIRTILMVPLSKEDEGLGLLTIYRREVRLFSDKEIALLQNFAAQAVIAMENARLITETREALEQQTATAEVLGVINSSPGDLSPVFDAMLERAMRLCGGSFGVFATYEGEHYRVAAARGLPPGLAEFVRGPIAIQPGSMPERLRRGEDTVQIPDIAALGPEHRTPGLVAMIELGNARTAVWLALRKDGVAQGFIGVYRQEVRPFSDKQLALLENFAAQAVIAMENARLITETREALEQQTATAEVLQVINSSPGDLAPVFDAMLEKAHTLCGAAHGSLQLYDGETLHAVATHAVSDKFAEILRQGYRAADSPASRALIEGKRFAHIADCAEIDHSVFRSAAELAGIRTVLFVPLRRDNDFLGLISAARLEVRPFSEKQIALLESFAAQAVIAMENARLITELRQRTRDLQESLEYQTATSDVLKVISRSGGELEAVLDTLVRTAARLCDAEMALIHRRDGGIYRPAAVLGFPPEFAAYLDAHPLIPGRGSVAGRVALEGRAIHIPDVAADPEYELTQSIVMAKQRTALGVPLLREDVPIGVIVLARNTVKPFTEKQIALVSTFADQAVIAIENARLFNELRDRTAELGRSVEELKMLSEVGQAVSSTLDLRSVLSTILTSSLGLTWANAGAIFRYSRPERAFRLVEAVGWDEALMRSVGDLRLAETETAMGEAVARRVPVQLADTAQRASNPLRDLTLAAGFHSALIVPLVGAERILGAILLMRQEMGEFPPETVRLMQTLASQSVLAIQNARLFREIADKSEQLALASQHKSQFLANMSHELRTPLNAILGYAELLVDGIYGVLPDRPKGVLERIQNNGRHLLALINDVLDLAKIEAGQLTLTLEDYALPEVVRSVVTATEPLATAKGLKFTAALQDNMPMAHGDARRVSQVLLNLVGNAIKFTDAGEVEIRAAAADGQFVLTVRDTGPGIPDADQDRIFGEFQQIDNSNTRQKGGTGLGLAISKRMVEMQGGTIAVESVLAQGSTFRVVLPVHVDEMMEAAE
jgi:GAF domain-containing protein/HAMP domain-containing protein